MVCAFWTIGFGLTFVGSVLSVDLLNMVSSPHHETKVDDFRSAIILAVDSILTEIIPLLLVIDARFVKIMTMEYLEKQVAETKGLLEDNELGMIT